MSLIFTILCAVVAAAWLWTDKKLEESLEREMEAYKRIAILRQQAQAAQELLAAALNDRERLKERNELLEAMSPQRSVWMRPN